MAGEASAAAVAVAAVAVAAAVVAVAAVAVAVAAVAAAVAAVAGAGYKTKADQRRRRSQQVHWLPLLQHHRIVKIRKQSLLRPFQIPRMQVQVQMAEPQMQMVEPQMQMPRPQMTVGVNQKVIPWLEPATAGQMTRHSQWIAQRAWCHQLGPG